MRRSSCCSTCASWWRCRGPLRPAIAAGDAGSAVVSYVLVFFAIWWAWMNFTWFSSAYDNDDVVYRLLTRLVQITGVCTSPPARPCV